MYEGSALVHQRIEPRSDGYADGYREGKRILGGSRGSWGTPQIFALREAIADWSGEGGECPQGATYAARFADGLRAVEAEGK